MVIDEQQRNAGQDLAVAAAEVGDDKSVEAVGRLAYAQPGAELFVPGGLAFAATLGCGVDEAGGAESPGEQRTRRQAVAIGVTNDVKAGRGGGERSQPGKEAFAGLGCWVHGASDAEMLQGAF